MSSMVNESELLINVVIGDKPKMLSGLSQKASGQDWKLQFLPIVDVAPPAKRQNLTYSGIYAERGKPVIFLQGKVSRKANR